MENIEPKVWSDYFEAYRSEFLLSFLLIAASYLYYVAQNDSRMEQQVRSAAIPEIERKSPTLKEASKEGELSCQDPAECCGGVCSQTVEKPITDIGSKKKDDGCCGGQCKQSDEGLPSNVGPMPSAAFHSFDSSQSNSTISLPVKIFYATQTGTAKIFAQILSDTLSSCGISNVIIDIPDYDTEDFFSEQSPCVFILSTYTDGGPTETAEWFYKWLEDNRFDFRVSKTSLSKMRYAVFGLGDSEYKENFCLVSTSVDKYLEGLGAKRLIPIGLGDKNDEMEKSFDEWRQQLKQKLESSSTEDNVGSHVTVEYESSDEEVDETIEDIDIGSGDEMLDVEDMGKVASKIQSAKKTNEEEEYSYDSQNSFPKVMLGDEQKPKQVPKDMVTPLLHKSLTKQGYKIIGSHSGVKICRWTKSMLRGRGGCYKHSFYGIESHRCMELTPSLACANKCVFCWRHHTNPVGTSWRWKMDDPEFILEGALNNHCGMVKMLKGVPGVQPHRFEEAMAPQHCALSLVGEPIMYPRINEFISLLHDKNISSFLVTNAQFPELITKLEPVTQLYVSIDASTKESLKKVDRPLFRDFWERFLACLSALREKGQRTVYRLTLVKQFNTEEILNYVELVNIGCPDFIEVKGVTYCGYSAASNLTMANVPYHNEVIHFCEQLVAHLPNYEISCEHEHSCSILIAHKKFFIDGKWMTNIDYPKFQSLYREYKATGKPFNSLDYVAATPHWSVFGDEHRGFDPAEQRFYRNKKKSAIS
ncbi:hypothetical protein BKA69DRAFT_1054309 [Paraphysoderma sedebokerense]|nr:hypothetical protein BKA69DRAFT_1054309 [Paraphysoderma sedebokerense]